MQTDATGDSDQTTADTEGFARTRTQEHTHAATPTISKTAAVRKSYKSTTVKKKQETTERTTDHVTILSLHAQSKQRLDIVSSSFWVMRSTVLRQRRGLISRTSCSQHTDTGHRASCLDNLVSHATVCQHLWSVQETRRRRKALRLLTTLVLGLYTCKQLVEWNVLFLAQRWMHINVRCTDVTRRRNDTS